ncbi:glycosyltransferase [Saliphagus infecundisoli]|uniref:Glycosyltransferase n=1 Tax=Saliphagus infecundisoli TaxID=1849069 RepID=A0ABD5QJ39_9EURY|nr:glycosyltransferase [Saliphagus infecundisoli]
MITTAFLIGNLNKEHGGAQQLLYNICSSLPNKEFDITVYYMFGEGTFQKQFERGGVNVVPLNSKSNYDIRTFFGLVNRLRKQRPDILHTNSPISGAWGRVAGQMAGVENIISTEHSVHTGYGPLTRYVNGLTLPLANVAVGVSHSVTRSFHDWERILLSSTTEQYTIQNGVDVQKIESQFENCESALSTHSPFSLNDTIIGTVGRLAEPKGIEYLVRSLPLVKQEYPQAKLLIVGGGPRRQKLEQLGEQVGVDDSIHFSGYVSNVYPLLPNFTVAAFPSLWEGFGLAPVETMVAEVPIVASEIDTFEEVIGDAGMLVPPKDPAALAEAITSLLDDQDRRCELGARGYDRAIERFSITNTVNAYAGLYRDLMATDA